jgi:endonuclease/exonuclease/phosphatase family metal-dependent hydrolase
MNRFVKLSVLFSGILLLLAACKPAEKDTLTVMSYNIRYLNTKDGDNSWMYRCTATPAMLNEVKPDIFGIQEAYPEQEQYIVEQCPRFVAYGVGRDDGENKGERMSIFYNKEVLEMMDAGTWWLSETPDVPSFGWDAKCRRTATWARMKDLRNGREFFFVNTHLDHVGDTARREGLKLVVSKIREMDATVPMVLTGDFNVEPADSCLTVLEGLMLDARSTAEKTDDTPSFNGWEKPLKVIDYIYYSGFTKAEEFRVVTETFDNKPFISDHYPIVSKLKY